MKTTISPTPPTSKPDKDRASDLAFMLLMAAVAIGFVAMLVLALR